MCTLVAHASTVNETHCSPRQGQKLTNVHMDIHAITDVPRALILFRSVMWRQWRRSVVSARAVAGWVSVVEAWLPRCDADRSRALVASEVPALMLCCCKCTV